MPPKNSVVRARDRARPSFSRSILAFGAAALMAAAISACSGGSSGSGSSVKDGFTQATQSAGPLTVWVDSTRVPAAHAFQKAHPNVKLNIVTYDGDGPLAAELGCGASPLAASAASAAGSPRRPA